ncbi:MAG: NusA antitermination factor [Candidatus Giovannonibacteria bacterium GW2011_GWA2_53_7]|uniref:Transcription termination/antitermination protein NusA n=1 Tax=Candidatus Giovannonibacteria bacterium GW2011_GWA2_53_7 TaxID=1618650 RepID=A0A0G2AVK3_9BACT|nr:MAG: NusA antitermination factor [Candidatus Giovannonibacteria bacterium GW2011_GWA2_53_7]
MTSQVEQAMRQICEEKGLSFEAVLETIESALAAAYRKDFGNKMQNIEVTYDVESGRIKAFDVKTVVKDVDLEEVERVEEARRAKQEERNQQVKAFIDRGEVVPEELMLPVEPEGPTFNEKTEIMFSNAKNVQDDAKMDEVLRMELLVPGEFGRMAAMTAKQVVMQKLREAEREVIFNDFKENEHTVVMGTIQRREGRAVLVDIGRATGVLRSEDQVPGERYNQGSRLKAYVRSVTLTARGPEILLSRTDNELVRELFATEIPEIAEGTVEIKGIAREPGNRTKIAVYTEDHSIDPIGACIGQRGTRIQTIIAELGGEKIDIVHWSEDPQEYIASALSPAKVDGVTILEEGTEREANVQVPEDQLSLAVGRGGQNVRLASRLVGMRINVLGAGKGEKPETPEANQEETSEPEGAVAVEVTEAPETENKEA